MMSVSLTNTLRPRAGVPKREEALLAEVRVLTAANGDPQAGPPHRALTANTGPGIGAEAAAGV
jgi:hypothetical protein